MSNRATAGAAEFNLQVNLVATQLVLDREHPNRMVFEDGQGLDPNIDLKFRGPNLRALIQGKASTWQSHLTLTPTGGSGGATPPLPSPDPTPQLHLPFLDFMLSCCICINHVPCLQALHNAETAGIGFNGHYS